MGKLMQHKFIINVLSTAINVQYLFICLYARTWEDCFSVLWLLYPESEFFFSDSELSSLFLFLFFCLSCSFSQLVPVKHQLSLGLRLSLPVSTSKNSCSLSTSPSLLLFPFPLSSSLTGTSASFIPQAKCMLADQKPSLKGTCH